MYEIKVPSRVQDYRTFFQQQRATREALTFFRRLASAGLLAGYLQAFAPPQDAAVVLGALHRAGIIDRK